MSTAIDWEANGDNTTAAGRTAARRAATLIEDLILDQGLPPGTNLGSESDLLERYSLSRPILRQALRLVEHSGLGRMKKGPAGGFMVTEPDHTGVTHASSQWLRFNNVGIDELFEARLTLEPPCALMAATRVRSAAAVGRLAELVAQEQRISDSGDIAAYTRATVAFHQAVAELSGNRVLWLWLQTLGELTMTFGGAPRYSTEEVRATAAAHQGIADAITAGDGPLASHRMIVHMQASREFSRTLAQTSDVVGKRSRSRSTSDRKRRSSPTGEPEEWSTER